MWWLLALASAWASVDDFVASADSQPVVLMQCDHADRVVQPMGAGSAFGLDMFANLSGGSEGDLFDLQAPIYLAVFASKTLDLRVEVSVRDPARLDEVVMDASVAEALDGATLHRRGDRLQVHVGGEGGFEGSGVSLLASMPRAPVSGCAVVVDVLSMLAGAPAPMPLLEGAKTVRVTFESPGGEHRVRVVGVQPSEVTRTVLTPGEGVGFPGAVSRVHFPLALQLHAPVDLSLRALAELMAPQAAEQMYAMVDEIPARFQGADGVQIGMGGAGVGGVIAIPMARPRGARRLMKVARRVGKRAGGTVERVSKDLVRIGITGRPPLSAGAREGLLVVAMREDVVRDVLEDAGEPWLPPIEVPYGARMRSDPGFMPFFPGLDGYITIGYEPGDPGALEVVIAPPDLE